VERRGRPGSLFTRLFALLAVLGAVLLGAYAFQSGRSPTSTGATIAPSGGGGTSASPSGSPTEVGGATPTPGGSAELTFTMATFALPAGSGPHDVAPARGGGVWYTAQRAGKLGLLDPATGSVREVPLGAGSAPHGVIVGPDDHAWVTDSGLNAIVRVDAGTLAVTTFPLPASAPQVNLNTAAFDGDGMLWFSGQRGYYGRLVPTTGDIRVFDAPRGAGPYGIAATPGGEIYYSSLAGSYLGAVDRATGEVRVIEPPTAGAGPRRCWSDSGGRIWVSEWNVGQVAVFDPTDGSWREWRLPGESPMAYAVYVDETDAIWLTDFGANAIVRFDPVSETFRSFPADSQPGEVRQLLGRPGEVWGAESAADRLIVIRSVAGA